MVGSGMVKTAIVRHHDFYLMMLVSSFIVAITPSLVGARIVPKLDSKERLIRRPTGHV